MLRARDESRRSLFNLIRRNNDLADEVIYIESSMDMLQDALESISLAIESAVERFDELMASMEDIGEHMEELTSRVESLPTDIDDISPIQPEPQEWESPF